METATHHDPAVLNPARLAALEKRASGFVPLDRETRTAVDTATAAFHLNRAAQTLRIWACRENGPIRPRRINGRLAWITDDLRRLLGLIPVAAKGGRHVA